MQKLQRVQRFSCATFNVTVLFSKMELLKDLAVVIMVILLDRGKMLVPVLQGLKICRRTTTLIPFLIQATS